MSGKPGSKEEAATAERWAKANVKSGVSILIKRQRAYVPDERDPLYDEGTPQ